jgi:hypothetical protein
MVLVLPHMMNFILSSLFLVALSGCTHRYVDYESIHKASFMRPGPLTPPVTTVITPGLSDALGSCFNQVLFLSNAEKEKDAYLAESVRALCPRSDWLGPTRVTNHWWTVLLFSRACVEVRTRCPAPR